MKMKIDSILVSHPILQIFVSIPILEMALAMYYSVEVLWKEKEVSFLVGRRKNV
jgi:hypothetical protein